MGFEDILNQWERSKPVKSTPPKRKKKSNPLDMDKLIDMYLPEENVNDEPQRSVPPRIKRRNYRRMKPQETLDLHGFTVASAIVELEDFFRRCRKRKIEKVLIIHGKGLHSENNESVLRDAVKNWLSVSKDVGEIGHPSEREGGCGATWAVLRY